MFDILVLAFIVTLVVFPVLLLQHVAPKFFLKLCVFFLLVVTVMIFFYYIPDWF